MMALVEAALGHIDDAVGHVAEARATTSCAEATSLAALAELIMRMQRAPDPSDETVIADATHTFRKAHADTIIDPLVMAYRAFPPLLTALASDPGAQHLVRDLCLRSGYKRRAEAAGLASITGAPIERESLAVLTRREREVLTLLAAGLSNSDIATRLVIEESTVKAHVRSVLRKLGVRSRLQAALLYRDLLDCSWL
jgi:ATP/maltotriose-dependent transcriptional regulator MalT